MENLQYLKITWYLISNSWLKEETKREIVKYFKLSKNRNNVLDVAKTVLSGTSIALNIYIKKEEISQINDLSFHLNDVEKE